MTEADNLETYLDTLYCYVFMMTYVANLYVDFIGYLSLFLIMARMLI